MRYSNNTHSWSKPLFNTNLAIHELPTEFSRDDEIFVDEALEGSSEGNFWRIEPEISVESHSLDDVLSAQEIVYTAAVLEMEADRNWTQGGSEQIFKRNIRSIEFYAAQAKILGADIVLCPEYGLEGLDHHSRNQSVFSALSLAVPSPLESVAPCDVNSSVFDPLHELSCTARHQQLYLVVDLAEKSCKNDTIAAECAPDQLVYYNTQVVFDRTGVVVARYRKRHLFLEPKFSPSPDSMDAALFTSDFGVTFSLQICFDILFEDPGYANVQRNLTRDIVMSTAWVDVAPFNLAPNVQNSFSRRLGVNLLASNYHWPEQSKLGSGVYRGYSDMKHAYTYDQHSGDVLVVAPVRTRLSTAPLRPPSPRLSRPMILKYKKPSDGHRQLNVRRFPMKLLSTSDVLNASSTAGQEFHVQVCHKNLCCDLQYQYMASEKQVYRSVAYSGLFPAGVKLIYLQLCGVVWCKSTDVDSCSDYVTQMDASSDVFGPFNVAGNFTSDITFPNAMTRNETLVSNDLYEFTEEPGYSSKLEFKQEVPFLLTSYLAGRNFSRDVPNRQLTQEEQESILGVANLFNFIV
ncbi:vanin-like protein [Hyalella azteca]|nr:vanin-like protein [Hyalella azteca]